MAKKFQKILISTIIFAITVVNYGLPLHSIASEGQKMFKFNFFHKDEIELNVYFDEDLDNTEKVLNVNETGRLTVELNPLIEGYLKEGTLGVYLKNGNENNFRIKAVTTEEQEKAKEELFNSVVKLEETKEDSKESVEKVEESKEEKVTSEEKTEKEEKTENVKTEATKNMGSSIFDAAKNLFIDSSIAPEENKTETKTENKVETNTLSSEIIGTVENKEEKNAENTNTVEETVKTEEPVEESKEETVLESDSQILEVEPEELYEVKLKNENEIEIKNVIEDTRLFIDFEYKQNEKLKAEDLYGEIIVTLDGNYINEDLEIIEIIQEKEVTVGWEYTKDVTASAQFTKVSPFTIGENFGTIIESVVSVKREINDVNSLPIKQSNIKIEIPKINDKLPKEISVSASKMMATLGKESVSTKAIKNYCTYDGENGVLEINVNNSKLALGSGEDKFNVICRYEDYYEEEKIKLNQNVEVMVEEYSTNTNVIQELSIKDEQEVTVKSGELVSYFVSDTEEKINKGKINANYYLENKYETEFSNVINLNILTSDVLEEILLQPSTDVYKDAEGNEFDATQDIKYKGVKFKTAEIQEMLEKGSTIDLLDGEGNVFHTISKENSVCAILFSEKIDDVKVRINGLHTNGTIKVEFVKAIETSSYPVEQFKNFTKIASAVDVSVKYAGLEESFALQKINIERNLSESYTKANIFMDRDYLSAIKNNDNVELKIELNNDKTESDLYTNPIFEVVFPSYIKEVTINNVSMLYKNGLSLKEYKVFNEEGVCKAQVILEGRQEGFNFSDITNGTNVIINANISINEVTPQKEDEIKLYYYNETVSNYQTQTHVGETLFGYDSTVFEYQTPVGLIVMNAISNFDDENKTINSIEQGEILENIEMENKEKIATMELTVINNTKEECIETVFLGRIPFKGNTDVETGKDIGCNIDTVMKTGLIANESNAVPVKIYYSDNPNATKDLNNGDNRWSEEVSNIEAIKSYLIVVEDTIKPNDVLKFKYDFQIPENLGYDARILGSFGAFYNKKLEALVMFDSSIADPVGLVTDAGPKLEAKLSVDAGEGVDVGEQRFLNYTLNIKNTGSLTAENISVVNEIPEYTTLYTYTSDLEAGNNNYIASEERKLEWNIEKLEPNEEETFTYIVKTHEIPTVNSYYGVNEIKEDENGFYYEKVISKGKPAGENADGEKVVEEKADEEKIEKVYIEKDIVIYIENKASMKVNNLPIQADSNTTKNKLVDSNLNIEMSNSCGDNVPIGEEVLFRINGTNITEETLENFTMEMQLPESVEYKETMVNLSQRGLNEDENGHIHIEHFDQNNIIFDETTRTVKVDIPDLYKDESINITVKGDVKKLSSEPQPIQGIFYLKDGVEERSTILNVLFRGPKLEIEHATNLETLEVMEDEYVEFIVIVKNTGNREAENIKIKDIVSTNLIGATAQISGDINSNLTVIDGIADTTVRTLESGKKFALKVSGYAKLDDDEIEGFITNKAEVSAELVEKLETEEINILVKRNPNKAEEDKNDNTGKEDSNYKPSTGTEYEGNDNNNNNYADSNSASGNQNNNPSDGGNNNQGTTGNNAAGDTNNNVNNDNNNNGNNNSNNNNNANNNGGQTNNQNANNGSQDGANAKEENEEETEETGKISGTVWLDKNEDGKKDDSEERISAIKVKLYKNGNLIRSVTTDGSGNYKFEKLTKGLYNIMFTYEGATYIATKYQANNIEDQLNSDAIETKVGSAVTNSFDLKNEELSNIDVGLIKRDAFNFKVNKYIASSTVTTGDKKETNKYDKLSLGKIEIKAKEIEKTTVELDYVIEIQNAGELPGTVGTIVDHIPEGMTFDENNKDWKVGSDGKLYNESLKNTIIQPKEVKTLTLKLTKKMTKDNTGVISNKVTISNVENQNGVKEENTDDNVSTQEMIITVKTGRTQTTIFVFAVITTLVFVVLIRKKIIFKRRYK